TTYVDTLKIKSIKIDSPIIMKSTLYQDSLGSLGPTKATSATIRFDVPLGTQTGFYTMELLVEACEASGSCSNFVHNSVVTVQSTSDLEIVSVEPTELTAGETANLEFTLMNHGDSALSNAVLSWADSKGNILPLGSDNRKFVSSIAGNDKVKVPVSIVVNPDATPGIYLLDVNIKYDDKTGNENIVSSSVGLKITGDFNFIATTESQDIITPGTTGNVNIKIANAGSQNAALMIIKILNSELEVMPSLIYVGKVKSDDYDTEKISVKAGSAMAPGKYTMIIAMEYKDIFGNSYNETKAVDVLISSPEEAGKKGDNTWIIVLLILIVIGYIAYRKLKKK
ncbi:MAG: hypothetical protein NT129_06225, partial [Candidatus Aenigmarchaeota archaeon]|nr:hypothetical protein [Candidatus Aenigmarchaeota archaeon]